MKPSDPEYRQFCYRCFRPQPTCCCRDINAIPTLTRFAILMHPKEARKVKLGTGRLTNLCLKNSEILKGVDFTEDHRIKRLIKDPAFFPVILYPGEDSTDISVFRFPDGAPKKPKILVFVIDASWTLAKKMLKLSANLRAIPKIHIRPREPSRYAIKKQPHKYCLSTIESVYFLLEELNRLGLENCRGHHRSLLEFLDRMCRFQQDCTQNEAVPGYRKHVLKPDKERLQGGNRYPGKRQRRSVCFD